MKNYIMGLVTTIKERVGVKKGVSILVLAVVIFLLGAFSSLMQRSGRSWVPVLVEKMEAIIGLNKPKAVSDFSFSTSRYEFETAYKLSGPTDATYQVTTVDSKNVIAMERNTGKLVMVTPDGSSYKESVISESAFPKDVRESIVGRKIDNSTPPLVMDLHFGLNRLLYSVVLQAKDKACQSLVLYEVSLGSPVNKELQEPVEHFRTPCVFDTQNTAMWGGRMATNSDTIFLSVGEERYDRSGYPKSNIFSVNDLVRENTVFGKILAFNPATFSHTVYTIGHRNAQGLFWDSERGQLLSSEHGPNGGDEVNVLWRGGDYGWPLVTFGKPYPTLYPSGLPEVNDSKNPSTGVDLKPERKSYLSGTHDGFIPPLMSWTPGVGVGNLIRVPSDSILKDWRGDILAATMGERHLHRLRLYKGVVIYDEDIPLDVRVRDLILLKSGNFALSLDQGSLFIMKVSQI